MKPIKTLIVDDEKLARRAVRSLLLRDPEIEVVGEAADGIEAREVLLRIRPELMFLDVQMPASDGFHLLQNLASVERPHTVFVTAFDQHALRAFDQHAVDYIVKPFSDARFFQAVERAKTRVRGGDLRSTERALGQLLDHLVHKPRQAPAARLSAERLVVKADGEMHFIEQKDIRWIEGQGDFVKIHTLGRSVLTRMTMQRIAGQLDPVRFLRIHKSSIVNLHCVRRLKPVLARSLGVELDDRTVLPVGRSYRLLLEKAL